MLRGAGAFLWKGFISKARARVSGPLTVPSASSRYASSLKMELDVDNLKQMDRNPQCPHGPAVLFHRTIQKGSATYRKDSFYACSAFRETKECRFHLPLTKGNRSSGKSVEHPGSERSLEQPVVSAGKHVPSVKNLQPGDCVLSSKVAYCKRCSRILDDGQEADEHSHKKDVQLVDLRFPTRFLSAMSKDQGEAQYFFSTKTVAFLLEVMRTLKVQRILNIGCPRLHEELAASSANSKNSIPPSFLLDIDPRFESFFPANHFARYNMFNHHFFSVEGRQNYLDFMAGSEASDILVIVDPPFGGMVQLLVNSLNRIAAENKITIEQCKIMWFFPYFLEKHITKEYPNFSMIGYKVEYDNHKKFKVKTVGAETASAKEGRGSPVRIFTNVAPEAFHLPPEEGYWFCEECRKYCSREAKHCFVCGACNGKDGKVWKHCLQCQRCVKGDWHHCRDCRRCHAKVCLGSGEK